MELEYTITKELFKEYAYQVRYKSILIGESIFSLSEIVLGIILKDWLIIFLSIIVFILVLSIPIIYVNGHFLVNKAYFKDYNKSKLILKSKIIIEDNNNHLEYDYSIVKSLKETKNLIVLGLPYGGALLISKEGMSLKDLNSLIEFIRNKTSIK